MKQSSSAAFDLSGMRILVVGAAGGIGGAAARLCDAYGASLILADAVCAESTRTNVGYLKRTAEVHRFDTGERRAVEAAAELIGPIDALIDAAAIFPNADWMADDFDETLDRVLRVNIKGPLNLARAFFPGMVARRSGRIVMCGSIAGWTGGLVSGPDYAVSKGGLHAFIRWLSRRGAPHNVLVNGVAPSTTNTRMLGEVEINPSSYPMHRVAEPEEVAAALVFLCSPGASYMSGAILDVNGGTHLR